MFSKQALQQASRGAALILALALTGAASDALAKGGDTTATPVPSILPTTPPAPGVLLRESFGAAEMWRPAGGKGVLKETYVHTPIQGFWVEYPGSKDTAWLAPSEGQTWRYCSQSTNPYEMPSPLQTYQGNGCLASEWFDPITVHPTALVPFRAPSGAYEISLNGYPSPVANTYLGFGFTSSSLLESNLETSGDVWLMLKAVNNTTIAYELRTQGMSGPVLASGTTFMDAFSRLVIQHDPVSRTLTASVNEAPLGVFAVDFASPRFIAIEGVGIVDNLVVRTLP